MVQWAFPIAPLWMEREDDLVDTRAQISATPCGRISALRTHGVAQPRGVLSARNASLPEIALDAGFYDESHFIRALCGQFGATPGAFLRERS